MIHRRLGFILNNRSLKILVGQGLWAASQAGIVFFVSYRLGIEAVADYVLALAVFSTFGLLFGQNARNLLAIDNNKQLAVKRLIKSRGLYTLIAYGIASAIMMFQEAGGWLFLILFSRVADQVSDLIFGYYQRQEIHERISISQGLRGGVGFLVILISFLESLDVIYLFSLYTFAVLCITLVYDVAYVWGASAGDIDTSEERIKVRLWRVYPFWDSLHLNFLRYSFVFFLSKQDLGVLGLAQVLYVPVQLFITAIGYSYITKARAMVVNGNKENSVYLIKGVLFGSVGALVYLFVCMLLPVQYFGYVFEQDPGYGREMLMYVCLIMLLLGAAGFISQLLLVRGKLNAYSKSPYVGLISFLLVLFIYVVFEMEVSYVYVLAAFVLSSFARLGYVFLNNIR